MKARRPSLAVNVNILIIIITLVISLSLIVITDRSYRKSILDPYTDKLNEAEIDTAEFSRCLSNFLPYLGTDELREVKKQEDAGKSVLIDWMSEKPSYTSGDPDTSRQNMFHDWISLDVLLNDMMDQINLDEACAEVVIHGSVYRISDCNKHIKKYSSNEDFGLEEPFTEDPAEDFASATLTKINGVSSLLKCFRFPLDEGEGRVWFSYNISDALHEHRLFLLNSIAYVLILTLIASLASVFLLQKYVTNPIRMLAQSAMQFQANDDGTYSADKISRVEVHAANELGDLSREITSMQARIVENTDHLTRMTVEKNRITTELNMAAQIQASMLPSIFPAFPDRKEFDLFASMTPARNVGGDFYDFFLIDDDHLALVIADVSGKGIPGALVMMVSKLILENSAIMSSSPAEILRAMNETVCSNNTMEMFITVWLGILEISSGTITAANAGHEYPVIYRKELGAFSMFKDPHGFVIGGMEGIRYKDYSFRLKPGDKLFVYTDGVPEATSVKEELFGNGRMITALNESASGTPEEILNGVRRAVDVFVGEAEQFDDLTMLCIEYIG